MAKYSKFHSNYILTQEHKKTKKGLITMRDWTTIGEIERFDRGKTPLYGNGNFRFTMRNVVSNTKKHKLSDWVGSFNYDDVKKSVSVNNEIEVNNLSKDMRDYAYYGSAVDLIRTTIENIINTFPGKITTTNQEMYIDGESLLKCATLDKSFEIFTDQEIVDFYNGIFVKKEFDETIYSVSNPFQIDLHRIDINITNTTNVLRYLTQSYKKYEISKDNGVFKPIIDYKLNLNYDKVKTRIENMENPLELTINKYNCLFYGLEIGTITMVDSDGDEYVFHGFIGKNRIMWGCKMSGITIQPNENIIEDYFQNLNGFEKVLLNRNSLPLYTTVLLTPSFDNDDNLSIFDKSYSFPTDGTYCIDIDSPMYLSYVAELYDMAHIYDSSYCNNIIQRMTHEAIKNLDWSYTREYDENEAEDNLDGSLRIETLLQLYGRLFDEIKHNIDGIKYVVRNTYDGYKNGPISELSDNLEDIGWVVTNTIPIIENKEYSNTTITEDFLTKYNYKWFDSCNWKVFTCEKNNTNFFKKLLINSRHIFRSKGTKNSIEMVMGMFGLGEDMYKVEEVFYSIKPVEVTEDTLNAQGKIFMTANLIDDDHLDGGVALEQVKVKNENGETVDVFVPFVLPTKNYHQDTYFQSNGGWCKFSDDVNYKYDYTETVPYTKILKDLDELFTQAPIRVDEDTIFYVADISKFGEYYNGLEPNSHYFILKDSNHIHTMQGWDNIEIVESSPYYDRVMYIENLLATNLGNNPHTGNGLYDLGNTYVETIKKPFGFTENSWTEQSEHPTKESFLADLDLFNFTSDFTEYKTSDDLQKIQVVNDETKKYFINSKVVKITNKCPYNALYSKFFKTVILQYLTQVIPSTTILILIDF